MSHMQQKISYRAALQAHKKAEHDDFKQSCQCGRSYKHATLLTRHKDSCQCNTCLSMIKYLIHAREPLYSNSAVIVRWFQSTRAQKSGQ